MSASRAVIFDLDGTLVDSRQAVVDAVRRGVHECLRSHGHEHTVGAETVRAALGKPALDYFRAVLPPGLESLAPEALQRSTHWEVEAMRAGQGRLFEGVGSGLSRLRERGWRLGVISNAQLPYFRAALEFLEIAALCEFSLCHEELPDDGDTRPAKLRLLERALMALGTAAEKSWMVGDRAEDLEAGRALGCSTAGARYGFGGPGELAIATLQMDEFADLVRALESAD